MVEVMDVFKLSGREPLFFGALSFLTVWRLLGGYWGFEVGVLWWWLGAVLGFVFVLGDRLVDALATPGREEWVEEVWKAVKARRWHRAGGIILEERKKVTNLTMRSEVFIAVYLILAFWTYTSGFSFFGRGFVLGLGLHLFFDLVWDFKNKSVDHWFWHIKRSLSEKEKTWAVVVATVLFVWVGWGL